MYKIKEFLLNKAKIVLTSLGFLVVLAVVFANPEVVETQTKDFILSLGENKPNLVNKFPKSSERKPLRSYRVIATAYSSEVNQTDGSPCVPSMASFNLCKDYQEHGVADTIAANFLPLGAKVRFPELYGEKVFTVRDRMNARYDGTTRIDFWKAKTSKAERFGVKRVKMEILKY